MFKSLSCSFGKDPQELGSVLVVLGAISLVSHPSTRLFSWLVRSLMLRPRSATPRTKPTCGLASMGGSEANPGGSLHSRGAVVFAKRPNNTFSTTSQRHHLGSSTTDLGQRLNVLRWVQSEERSVFCSAEVCPAQEVLPEMYQTKSTERTRWSQ